MSLFEQLKKDKVKAMKEKDDIKKTIIGTLIAEASRESLGEGIKEPPDDKVYSTIRKMIVNNKELLAIRENDALIYELIILESYLPKQLSESEIRSIIVLERAKFIESQGKDGVDDVKSTMEGFKLNYPGRYDGALVARIAKGILG
jgi:uncharacterized protein YqeY